MIFKNLHIEKVEAPEVTKDNITMSFIASTQNEDRYGDIINQENWDLSKFKKNPIILFNHNSLAMPIGKGSAEVVNGQLLIDIDFDMEDPFAAEVGRKAKAGFLNAVSVGFNPIEGIERSELPEDHFAKGEKGMYFDKAELLEVSIVTIPANGEAVAAKAYQDETINRLNKTINKLDDLIASLDLTEKSKQIEIGQKPTIEKTKKDQTDKDFVSVSELIDLFAKDIFQGEQ